ncbi:peptidoglycan amidohydrolase family protein [Leuconostoc fallax]|uniref:Bacteriophage lysin domain-containing protein n=1 Tax=Leuconostoc fallax TaxID=1251 RepID=A0A4R5N868_9LACO|nr:peptidoglycan amidohydrolase family protein [Leuconostoc fallax]TDG68085.1 hypothetical protein C5L23_000391 [Leuconostoc fallax]
MAYNVAAAIANMRSGKGRTIYSMNYRQNENPRMRDCSSSIAEALLAGGVNVYYANGMAPNTVGMLQMEGTKFQRITEAQAHTGDICIMGGRGGNGGAGHVFMLTSDSDEIECTPNGWNGAGVYVDASSVVTAYAINEGNYGYLKTIGWQMDWFRPIAGGTATNGSHAIQKSNSNPVDQVLDIGSKVRFDGFYHLDSMQEYGDEGKYYAYNQQISYGLPDYNNYIPISELTEVDKNGKPTKDQLFDFKPGWLENTYFRFNGTYKVIDIDEENNAVCIEIGGEPVWTTAAVSGLKEVK